MEGGSPGGIGDGRRERVTESARALQSSANQSWWNRGPYRSPARARYIRDGDFSLSTVEIFLTVGEAIISGSLNPLLSLPLTSFANAFISSR